MNRNSAGKFAEDQGQLFLDNTIALAGFIYQDAAGILEISDDPAVQELALFIQARAIVIQSRSRQYRQEAKRAGGVNTGPSDR